VTKDLLRALECIRKLPAITREEQDVKQEAIFLLVKCIRTRERNQ